MSTERRPVRYITLADDDHQPLGVVAHGGAAWMINCGLCSHATPISSPDAGVAELLDHIERAHPAGPLIEVSEVVD